MFGGLDGTDQSLGKAPGCHFKEYIPPGLKPRVNTQTWLNNEVQIQGHSVTTPLEAIRSPGSIDGQEGWRYVRIVLRPSLTPVAPSSQASRWKGSWS